MANLDLVDRVCLKTASIWEHYYLNQTYRVQFKITLIIIFEKLRFKNFLSYENTWTEVNLNQGQDTLINR